MGDSILLLIGAFALPRVLQILKLELILKEAWNRSKSNVR